MENQMNSVFRFLFAVFCLFVTASPALAQWVPTNKPGAGVIQSLVGKGANLFAGTFGGGVFFTANGGAIWTPASNGLTNLNAFTLTVNGANLFAGTGGGVFVSANNGASWSPLSNGLTNTFVVSLLFGGTNFFAGTNGGGVFRSTNGGVTWNPASNGLTNPFVHVLAQNGANLFAGTDGGGVFLSVNNGTSWSAVNTGLPPAAFIFALVESGGNLFAGTDSGKLFRSTDNGANWTEAHEGLSGVGVFSLVTSGTTLFAVTSGGGVFLSTDSGANWTAINDGLRDPDIHALTLFGTNLFAVTGAGDVWKRPVVDAVTSAGPPATAPASLAQNVPNPFNPQTMIPFTIQNGSDVRLSIYDLTGRQVRELVRGHHEPGSYRTVWDGLNATGTPVASGVYFYKLVAGTFGETKKMMLLK